MHFISFVKSIIIAPFHSWLGLAIMMTAVLTIALVSHRIGMSVFTRLVRSQPILSLVLRSINQPTRFALALFALQIVLGEALTSLPFVLLLRNTSVLLLISTLTWLGVRLAAVAGEALIQMHPLDKQDNLYARRIHTQARVLTRCMMVIVVILGIASVLMTFPSVRQIGTSLLASAGVAGVVAGIAARPVLGNLIAGLQIALTQPIRLDDVVVIQGEWGRIEEITGSYVVVRIWDQRRLVVPLQWIIENPFQNWTRTNSQIIGTVFLWVDYRMPLDPLRTELARLCETAPEWDRRVQVLQVTDANERAMQLRVLVSSVDSPLSWDLRCRLREGLLSFIQQRYPDYLPRARAEVAVQQEESMG